MTSRVAVKNKDPQNPQALMKKIDPRELVPMDLFFGGENAALEIDLAYAKDDNLLFSETIYREDARLWLHIDLAKIVLLASRFLARQGLTLVLYDGLRTIEAQARMANTKRSLANPQWTQGPERLLSPPGAGGHPRGMAVDVALKTAGGPLLDMGTPFDELAQDSSAAKNPAHRDYQGHSPEIMKNRKILDLAMLTAADALRTPLIGLPAEWWDFRQPAEIYNAHAPLSDADLPAQMRMTDTRFESAPADLPPKHFNELKAALEEEVAGL